MVLRDNGRALAFAAAVENAKIVVEEQREHCIDMMRRLLYNIKQTSDDAKREELLTKYYEYRDKLESLYF